MRLSTPLFILATSLLLQHVRRLSIALFFMLSLCYSSLNAQDTLRLNFPQFFELAKEHSSFLRAEYSKKELADVETMKANALKWVPRFEISSNHGLVPGVISDSARDRAFLDPNLRNDWSNWGIFTTVQLQAVQPLFTWGAINNAINAAQKAADAAAIAYQLKEDEFEKRMYQLYQGYVLGLQSQRLLKQAKKTFSEAEKKLKELADEGEDISMADEFKFKLYRFEFDAKVEETQEQLLNVQRIWHLLIGISDFSKTVYLPADSEVVPNAEILLSVDQYSTHALSDRKEIKALNNLVKAAEYGFMANKAKMYPALFLGLGADFVTSPRPTQNQPMFGDRYTYANVFYTFGFRVNLNFLQNKYDKTKSQLQLTQTIRSRTAVQDAINMEVSKAYADALTAYVSMNKTEEALQVSKEWLRQEQLDYDLGFGEIDNLVDAVKTNLELEAKFLEKQYQYNLKHSALLSASGKQLTTVNNE